MKVKTALITQGNLMHALGMFIVLLLSITQKAALTRKELLWQTLRKVNRYKY